MAPRDVHLTESQLSDIADLAAKGAADGADGKDDIEAQQELKGIFKRMIKTKEFGDITKKAEDMAKREHAKGGSGVNLVGKLTRQLYEAAKDDFEKALDDLKKTTGVKKIMKGIWFGLCLIAAIIAVVTLGIVEFIIAVLCAVVKGVWTVIKAVTGFIWSVFVSLIKQPGFWATVTGVGAGVAFANPLVGVVVMGVGAIGTGISAALRD